MTAALIMAGGRSSRMRASGDKRHKALRDVLGVPLLERNLRQFLAAGFREIYVAVNSMEPAIEQFVATLTPDLTAGREATIKCLVETEPLGTIGIAQRLAHLNQDVVVMYVDNLTTLSLTRLVQHHQDTQSAMTIATHVEEFQIPFGEVVCERGQIVDYREKPRLPVRISSGVYVLASRACQCIAANQRIDTPDLIPHLRAKGESVAAFEHDSPWIDVNDVAALLRAEEMILAHPDSFAEQMSKP